MAPSFYSTKHSNSIPLHQKVIFIQCDSQLSNTKQHLSALDCLRRGQLHKGQTKIGFLWEVEGGTGEFNSTKWYIYSAQLYVQNPFLFLLKTYSFDIIVKIRRMFVVRLSFPIIKHKPTPFHTQSSEMKSMENMVVV